MAPDGFICHKKLMREWIGREKIADWQICKRTSICHSAVVMRASPAKSINLPDASIQTINSTVWIACHQQKGAALVLDVLLMSSLLIT
jgi:hypothetical protein